MCSLFPSVDYGFGRFLICGTVFAIPDSGNFFVLPLVSWYRKPKVAGISPSFLVSEALCCYQVIGPYFVPFEREDLTDIEKIFWISAKEIVLLILNSGIFIMFSCIFVVYVFGRFHFTFLIFYFIEWEKSSVKFFLLLRFFADQEDLIKYFGIRNLFILQVSFWPKVPLYIPLRMEILPSILEWRSLPSTSHIIQLA